MYATLDELKTWISSTSDEGFDDHHLEPILLACERWIDRECGRHFTLENEATKVYLANSPTHLDVVDLISVTSLKTDTAGDRTYATTLATSDYQLLPHLDESGRSAARYQQVMIWPRSSRSFGYNQYVQIVGDFGYVVDGQAPSEVRLATLILASRWWKRHEMPTGIAFVPDIGVIDRIAREDPDVNLLLDPYKRTNSAWVLA